MEIRIVNHNGNEYIANIWRYRGKMADWEIVEVSQFTKRKEHVKFYLGLKSALSKRVLKSEEFND